MTQIAADATEMPYEKILRTAWLHHSREGRLRFLSFAVDGDGRLGHSAGGGKAERKIKLQPQRGLAARRSRFCSTASGELRQPCAAVRRPELPRRSRSRRSSLIINRLGRMARMPRMLAWIRGPVTSRCSIIWPWRMSAGQSTQRRCTGRVSVQSCRGSVERFLSISFTTRTASC